MERGETFSAGWGAPLVLLHIKVYLMHRKKNQSHSADSASVRSPHIRSSAQSVAAKTLCSSPDVNRISHQA